MIIKVESYKIFSEIYCPIMPAPLELFFGDGCRSENCNPCEFAPKSQNNLLFPLPALSYFHNQANTPITDK